MWRRMRPWWKVVPGDGRGAASAAAPVCGSTLLRLAPQRMGAPQAATTIWPQLFPEPRRPSCMCCAPPDSWRDGRIIPFGPHRSARSAARPWPPCCAGFASCPVSWPSVGRTVAMTLAILCGLRPAGSGPGRRSGFLMSRCAWGPPLPPVAPSLGWLLMPALGGKNCCFASPCCLPSAGGEKAWRARSPGALSWGAVCESLPPPGGAHLDPSAKRVFHDPVILGAVHPCWGLACPVAYNPAARLAAPLLIHWLAVTVWLGPSCRNRRHGAGDAMRRGSSTNGLGPGHRPDGSAALGKVEAEGAKGGGAAGSGRAWRSAES